MNEKNGTRDKPTVPVAPDNGQRAPVMDVVRRQVNAPAQRPEVAPPPPEVMAQIAPNASQNPVSNAPNNLAQPVAPVAPSSSPLTDGGLKEPPQESSFDDLPTEPPIEAKAASKPQKANPSKPESAPQAVKPPKQSVGVAGVIAVTIIIMIILSALAIFAYSQSQ